MSDLEADDLDELPVPLQAVMDDVLTKLVGATVMNIDRALQTVGLDATVEIKQKNRHFELIVRSSSLSSADIRRAEAIADAVLESTLMHVSHGSPKQRLH